MLRRCSVMQCIVRAGHEANPFQVKAKPMGLRDGIDPTALNKIAGELEADAIVSAARHK